MISAKAWKLPVVANTKPSGTVKRAAILVALGAWMLTFLPVFWTLLADLLGQPELVVPGEHRHTQVATNPGVVRVVVHVAVQRENVRPVGAIEIVDVDDESGPLGRPIRGFLVVFLDHQSFIGAGIVRPGDLFRFEDGDVPAFVCKHNAWHS